MKKFFYAIILAGLLSGLNFGQHKVDFVFKLKVKTPPPVSYWLTITADSSSFNEGQAYVVPPFTLPSAFSKLQPAYDAVVGSVFKLESGALNDDLFLEITLDSLDAGKGTYVPVFGDTLFVLLKIKVFVNGKPYSGEYVLNKNKYLTYSIPKTQKFLTFLNSLGLKPDDLGFAFVGKTGWDPVGIFTENTKDSIKFKAVHMSKFGGGRGHISSTTGVELNYLKGVPAKYELGQNYPNPFNPTTKIRYSLPKEGYVSLKVFNILGSEVATLVSQNQKAGNYELEFNASNLPSGIYFYTLSSNNVTITKKMMLVK